MHYCPSEGAMLLKWKLRICFLHSITTFQHFVNYFHIPNPTTFTTAVPLAEVALQGLAEPALVVENPVIYSSHHEPPFVEFFSQDAIANGLAVNVSAQLPRLLSAVSSYILPHDFVPVAEITTLFMQIITPFGNLYAVPLLFVTTSGKLLFNSSRPRFS